MEVPASSQDLCSVPHCMNFQFLPFHVTYPTLQFQINVHKFSYLAKKIFYSVIHKMKVREQRIILLCCIEDILIVIILVVPCL